MASTSKSISGGFELKLSNMRDVIEVVRDDIRIIGICGMGVVGRKFLISLRTLTLGGVKNTILEKPLNVVQYKMRSIKRMFDNQSARPRDRDGHQLVGSRASKAKLALLWRQTLTDRILCLLIGPNISQILLNNEVNKMNLL